MKSLSILMLSLVFGFMVLAALQTTSHLHQQHLQAGCPTTMSETVCPTVLEGHLAAWKGMFLAVVPMLLAVVLGMVLKVWRTGARLRAQWRFWTMRRHRWSALPVLERQHCELTYRYFVREFQELFARGILNPKVYA